MEILDELVNYCKDPDPVGALMLTGEWGCGKTFFIVHDFAESVKDQYIIVRISLFGIDSVDALHKAIRLAWLDALIGSIDHNDVGKRAKARLDRNKEKILSLIGISGEKGKILQQLAEVMGIRDICPLKPLVNEKTVVLVFDDMERSQVNQTDLLGCINDYCENQHFHVIVVANEEKMRANRNIRPNESKENKDTQNVFVENLYMQEIKEEIPYGEIKEKAIQRTVVYEPNYETIVQSIVDAYKLPNEKDPDYDIYKNYREMLLGHKTELVEIFEMGIPLKLLNESEGSESGERKTQAIPPHNLRSFKCAIHDFFRIYKVLQKFEVEEIEKYLFSFVVFVMVQKAGKNMNGEDTYSIFSRQRYMFETVKKWVIKGEWNEEQIEEEIQYMQQANKALKPVDVVRISLIVDIEEDVIQEGFPDVLQLAYSGALDLNDYVNLIINSCLSRECEYSLPEEIDWGKIIEGIKIRFQKMIDEDKDDYYRSVIKGIDLKTERGYSDQEKAAYQLIDEFRKSDRQMFTVNKKLYIDRIREGANEGLIVCRNKRFDVFDQEMAEVTATAFLQEKNAGKREFVYEFYQLWKERCSSKYELRVEDSIEGFKCLENLLMEGKKKFQEQNLKISEKHTESFIKKVEEMIKLLSQSA